MRYEGDIISVIWNFDSNHLLNESQRQSTHVLRHPTVRQRAKPLADAQTNYDRNSSRKMSSTKRSSEPGAGVKRKEVEATGVSSNCSKHSLANANVANINGISPLPGIHPR